MAKVIYFKKSSDACGKSVERTNKLSKVIYTNKISWRGLKCKVCGKIFSTLKDIMAHLKCHSISFDRKVPKKIARKRMFKTPSYKIRNVTTEKSIGESTFRNVEFEKLVGNTKVLRNAVCQKSAKGADNILRNVTTEKSFEGASTLRNVECEKVGNTNVLRNTVCQKSAKGSKNILRNVVVVCQKSVASSNILRNEVCQKSAKAGSKLLIIRSEKSFEGGSKILKNTVNKKSFPGASDIFMNSLCERSSDGESSVLRNAVGEILNEGECNIQVSQNMAFGRSAKVTSNECVPVSQSTLLPWSEPKCGVCGKVLSSLKLLKKHLENHNISCGVSILPKNIKCGKPSEERSSLSQGECSQKISQKECKCRVCGIIFSSSKYLNRHVQRHISCEVCKERFTSSVKLAVHRETECHEIVRTNVNVTVCESIKMSLKKCIKQRSLTPKPSETTSEQYSLSNKLLLLKPVERDVIKDENKSVGKNDCPSSIVPLLGPSQGSVKHQNVTICKNVPPSNELLLPRLPSVQGVVEDQNISICDKFSSKDLLSGPSSIQGVIGDQNMTIYDVSSNELLLSGAMLECGKSNENQTDKSDTSSSELSLLGGIQRSEVTGRNCNTQCCVNGDQFTEQEKLQTDNSSVPSRLYTSGLLYQCGECGISFQSLMTLEIHMKSHIDSLSPFYKSFASDVHADETRRLEGGSCSEVSSATDDLITDKSPLNFSRLQPDACSEMFKSTDKSVSNCGQALLQCCACFEVFKSIRDFTTHISSLDCRSVKEDLPYKCGECGFQSWHLYSLEHHMATHHDESNYRCDSCNLGFVSSDIVKRHITIVGSDLPFHCEVCKRTFPCRVLFKTHMINKHTLPTSTKNKRKYTWKTQGLKKGNRFFSYI